ncbi:DUF262 domain-containing protein [Tsukamurella soli]
MADDRTNSRPEAYTISELSDYARSGRIRVPRFQRAFRWTVTDVIELFDSIRRGYPVGNVLLWRRRAEADDVVLGGLAFHAGVREDALWVVDGQQRITSLVNAVAPESFANPSFAVSYVPETDRFVRAADVRAQIAVPLPDLFSITRLVQWLQNNPEATDRAEQLQSVTTRLRDFTLPGTVIESTDEGELRRIFDRVNNAGKRLTASEVFDAINRADGADGEWSTSSIADRLAAATTFGRLSEQLVYQAVLVRRNPDITRRAQREFEPERSNSMDFPDEDQAASFAATEAALRFAIGFLDSEVGVPHIAFLPQQFLMLTVTRFFAHFPEPQDRTRQLLAQWCWRAASRARRIGLTGDTSTVRALARRIHPGDEFGSIQRLLDAVVAGDDEVVTDIDAAAFRTNQAASKIMLCALWSHRPRSLHTGEPLTAADLDAALGEDDTPAQVVWEIAPRRRLSSQHRNSVGNRIILTPDDLWPEEWFDTALDTQNMPGGPDIGAVLASHLLPTDAPMTFRNAPELAVEQRERAVAKTVRDFIQVRTGAGFPDTPPLLALDLDEEFAGGRPDA